MDKWKKVRKDSRVVGQLRLFADVSAMPTEATVPDSVCNAAKQAFTQLRSALTAYGPFLLGASLEFIEKGILVDVVDASDAQDASFDRAQFEAFVQRAHGTCAADLDGSVVTPEDLAASAKEFAEAEGRKPRATEKLFKSIAGGVRALLVTASGKAIQIGLANSPTDQAAAHQEFRPKRVSHFTRAWTSVGPCDVPDELAEGVHVGDRIRVDGIEPASGAVCVFAKHIAAIDASGELFDDSTVAQVDRHPDDPE